MKYSYCLKWMMLFLVLLSAALPVFAQEDEEPVVLIEISGTVEVIEDDLIIVDEVEVAPSGAFLPATLNVGDQVTITGYFNDEGVFIAVELEVTGTNPDLDGDGVENTDDNCPLVANPEQEDTNGDGVGDACDQAMMDSDEDGVPDSDDNCPFAANPDQADADADGTGDACEEDGDTGSCVDTDSHPVAQVVADQLGVDYDTVIGWHCDGFGFGDILIAARLADELGTDAESLLVQFGEDGEWGEIMKAQGLHPADFFAVRGGLFSGDDGEDVDSGPPPFAGPGHNDDDETDIGPPSFGGPGSGDDDHGGPPPFAGPPANRGGDDDDDGGGPPSFAGPGGRGDDDDD